MPNRSQAVSALASSCPATKGEDPGAGRHPCSRESLGSFIREARLIAARVNQVIYREGWPNTDVYYVVSGRVRSFAGAGNARRFAIGEYLPGDFVGLLGALTAMPALATVSAAETSMLRVMERDAFLRLMRLDPQFALAIAELLAEKARIAYVRSSELALESLETRVVATLGRLAEKFGVKHEHGTMIDRPITTHELASMVAASRPRVSLAVQELIRRGRLARIEGRFVVHS